MATSGYYGDQPAFAKKDPLTRWSWFLFIGSLVAAIWVFLVFFLLSQQTEPNDEMFGFAQSTWVMVGSFLLVLSLVGFVFVIVSRLGGTAGGGYLAAELREEEARRAAEEADVEAVDTQEDRPVSSLEQRQREALLAGARVEDPFGPDGRMVLSYTHPPQAHKGVFGDTYVAVDSDAVLNIRTLLYERGSRR
ncbi:MAG: hypothetical protein KY455_04345 [Euryarchaeota archaeon]|nr:hypothetical protein [Euryarchaeota archaeon]